MREEIILKDWYRKDHFDFFSQFDEPFFGITTKIDCTTAYQKTRDNNQSFFLYYLHKSLVAANRIEPLRYRISEDRVFKYEVIHASPTINREDGTFGFSYIQFHSEFETFASEAKLEIDKVRNEKGLKAAVTGENVIHYSSLPWIDFTSVSHARHFSFNDSCPKITFGKMTSNDNLRSMPVSIHAHHALIDGYHIGQFLELFQILMNE